MEEVEQVRIALGLDRENFYLYGQSWGGLLAIEYALKYQERLKGLIISNMMAGIPQYNAYAHAVLMPGMDPGRSGGDPAVRGGGGLRKPALHGAPHRAPLRAPRAAHAS